MTKLLVYLKDYKKETILGPLFKLLEASFELFVPLVMASLIDVGIAGQDRNYIYRMCAVLIVLALVGLVCAVTAQYFAAKAAVGFAAKLRHALFSHIETLSFTEMDTIGTSTMITRMTSDINQVQSGVNLVIRLFLRSPFIVFGAMVMAFTVDVKAALVFVVTIPLLSIVVFAIILVSIPMFQRVQGALDRILCHTRENLSGVRVIRAFNKEEEEMEAFEESNGRLMNLQLLVGRVSALMNPLTYIIINAAIIAVIWIGGKRVYSGSITQGEVVALVSYMSQILVELIKLANLIINVTKSAACGKRIEELLEVRSSITDPAADGQEPARSEVPTAAPHPSSAPSPSAAGAASPRPQSAPSPAVAFSHVCMAYAGAPEEALTDLDFTVERGQTIGIIGGTGSGKSTLVNLIPRFYDVTKGTVYVDGRDVREYPLDELRQKIGVVMQESVLFAGSIADNLRWGNPDATEEEMWNALETAQAAEVVRGKRGGLSFMIEQGGKNLSGGQRQRLSIARAVVKDPEILILDDSASALDFATDAKLRAALRGLHGEKTIFIVSQRTSSIRSADRILVLDDGKAVGIGRHDELLAECAVYREIYESQFKKENRKGGAADGRA